MLCQRCKQKNATTYYTQTINGEKREIALCDECAKELSGGFDFLIHFLFLWIISFRSCLHRTQKQ